MDATTKRIAELIELHDYCGQELQKDITQRDRKQLLDTRRECCEEIERLEGSNK